MLGKKSLRSRRTTKRAPRCTEALVIGERPVMPPCKYSGIWTRRSWAPSATASRASQRARKRSLSAAETGAAAVGRGRGAARGGRGGGGGRRGGGGGLRRIRRGRVGAGGGGERGK